MTHTHTQTDTQETSQYVKTSIATARMHLALNSAAGDAGKKFILGDIQD